MEVEGRDPQPQCIEVRERRSEKEKKNMGGERRRRGLGNADVDAWGGKGG